MNFKQIINKKSAVGNKLSSSLPTETLSTINLNFAQIFHRFPIAGSFHSYVYLFFSQMRCIFTDFLPFY